MKSTKAVLLGKVYSEDREIDDFYATDPKAIDFLLEKEKLHNVWECACGNGHLAKRLEEHKILGKASDLIIRDYKCEQLNFLQAINFWDGDIVTNPPYKYAEEFVYKALKLIPTGNKVCMFLKLSFLESIRRKPLFDLKQLKNVYVPRHRIVCAKDADFKKYKSSAVCFAWFVWQKEYKDLPKIDWIN